MKTPWITAPTPNHKQPARLRGAEVKQLFAQGLSTHATAATLQMSRSGVFLALRGLTARNRQAHDPPSSLAMGYISERLNARQVVEPSQSSRGSWA